MKLRNKKTGGLANCEPIEVKTDAGFHDYYSLAELNEYWEDYKPSDPLIKDEKVRKAIRAWYEALPLDGITEKRIMFSKGYFCVGIYRIDCGNYVVLKGIKERYYTIKELCGEEEC